LFFQNHFSKHFLKTILKNIFYTNTSHVATQHSLGQNEKCRARQIVRIDLFDLESAVDRCEITLGQNEKIRIRQKV